MIKFKKLHSSYMLKIGTIRDKIFIKYDMKCSMYRKTRYIVMKEIGIEVKKIKKSRALDMAKSRLMTTLTQAKKLLASVEHTESNRTPINAVKKLIAQVESGEKTASVLSSVKSLITDAATLNKLNDEVTELRTYSEKPIKSRALDMAKSRAKANFLRDVRLTPEAEKNLNRLCEELKLNKTQVINKLLKEQKIEKQINWVKEMENDHPFDD